MLSDSKVFTKDNVDRYLKELGKEYRRLNKKGTPAEIVLIGGASVLINYGFRDMTTDIDALIHAASIMKEAIGNVAVKYDLPDDWLNNYFKKTSSFTFKLFEFSKYYKTFYGVLTVRVISGEYLIAMKLMAGRLYKNDKSDVVGILAEHERNGKKISKESIIKAFEELYGSWDNLSEESKRFLDIVLTSDKSFEEQYADIREEEISTRNAFLEFMDNYPEAVNKNNAQDIVKLLAERQKNKE